MGVALITSESGVLSPYPLDAKQAMQGRCHDDRHRPESGKTGILLEWWSAWFEPNEGRPPVSQLEDRRLGCAQRL